MGKNLAIAILGLAVLVLLAMDTRHRSRYQILCDRTAHLGENLRPQSAISRERRGEDIGDFMKTGRPIKSLATSTLTIEPEAPAPGGLALEPAADSEADRIRSIETTNEPDLIVRARRVAFWIPYPGILDLQEHLDLSPEQKLRIAELLQARERDLIALDARKEELRKHYEAAVLPWLDTRQQEAYNLLCSRVPPPEVRLTVGETHMWVRQINLSIASQLADRDCERHAPRQN